MKRPQESLLFLVAILGSLISMTELGVKWQIAGIMVTIITLFIIIFFRVWDYLFSEKGHPRPLKTWFTEEGFSVPYVKIKNPKIPIGKSELWYVVGPRIATEFEVINIRFVDPDRKASVGNVDFDRPVDFPKLRKRELDGKGGMDIIFRRPYRMIPPRQYLRIKLTVEGHKAGEDYVNFRAPIGRGRMARFIYGKPQKVIIELPISDTEDSQNE